jgi:hypothetical protein
MMFQRAAAAFLLAGLVGFGCSSSEDRDTTAVEGSMDPAAESHPARPPGSKSTGEEANAPAGLLTGSMSGRVLDAEGRPLAGATVDLTTHWMTEEETSLIRNATTTTDSEGRYVISRIREHPGHSIRVKHDDHAVECLLPIVVEGNSETRNPDICLARGRTIRGRVFDESGRPIQGVLIKPRAHNIYIDVPTVEDVVAPVVETMEDTTDAEGRYELTHLRPLVYDVHAWREGFLAGVVDVSLGDAEAVDAPDITLGLPLTFAVIVVDRAKRPIEGAAVLLQGHGFEHLPILRTDSWGRLELKGLETTPRRMEVSAPGYVQQALDEPKHGAEIVLEPEAR